MIRSDYIMRMIEQLSQVLTQIIMGKKVKTEAEIEQQINDLIIRYTGLHHDFILNLNSQELLNLFNLGSEFDYTRCIIVAYMLYEYAKIAKRDSNKQYIKSLSLYLKCLDNIEDELEKIVLENIQRIIKTVSYQEMQNSTLLDLLNFFERKGLYSNAEDCLYELVDRRESNIYDIGLSFYHRLLRKSNKELKSGNLPREELYEGIEELKKKL